MQSYTIQEAKEQFNNLLEAALHGETVLIQVNEQQSIQLTPLQLAKKPRKAGSAQGLIKMADDFDAPLDDFAAYS
jgi:antitoxin (DNA-binding transcriptional repressor) of toxin-antitoxin stability system